MIKVLIIDDDPDVRTLMDALMKKHGYEVDTASRGEEVFTKIKEFNPAVILLDVLLNGADGRDICRQIKANEQTKHIQVIMFSAHPGAADNIASYGADHFVSKPVNTKALLQKLDNWVKELK
jgi:DNA-binding response OmpR family regulator